MTDYAAELVMLIDTQAHVIANTHPDAERKLEQACKVLETDENWRTTLESQRQYYSDSAPPVEGEE